MAAGQPYDNSWEPDDERLPFVYKAWMQLGAPEPSKLAGMAHGSEASTAPSMPSCPPAATPPGLRIPPLQTQDTPRPATPPTPAPSNKNVNEASKGKQRQRVEQHDSDAANDGTASAAEWLRVHRYAPFMLEKQKKVTGMVQDFFKTLAAYAKEENIDLTAVTKCFNAQLTSMKLSPWQAIQRLLSIERHGGSKYICILLLYFCKLITVRFFSGQF